MYTCVKPYDLSESTGCALISTVKDGGSIGTLRFEILPKCDPSHRPKMRPYKSRKLASSR